MAITRLSDVLSAQPKVFADMVRLAATDVSRFRQSGVVQSNDLLNQRAVGAGFETTIPGWNPLYLGSEASSVDDTTTAITPRKVSTSAQVARRFHRALAYSAANITERAIGASGISFAAGELGRLWNDDEELLMMAQLKSIELGNTEFVKSFTKGTAGAADPTANYLDPTNAIKASTSMGDAADATNVMVVHSDVLANMQMREPNAFVPASQTNINIVRYLNRWTIIASDRMGKDTTDAAKAVYTSYQFGAGVFAYGDGGMVNKLVNDELAGNGGGQTTLVTRSTHILHPQGFNCAAVPANGVSLTNTEASASGAYVRVAERKAIPLTIIKTNG